MTPIAEFHNAEFMVTGRVFAHAKGFSALLRDDDSGETFPEVRIFADVEAAKRYAAGIAGVEPIVGGSPYLGL